MQKKYLTHLVIALAFCFMLCQPASCQETFPKVEVGGVTSIIDLRDSVGEKTIGVGGRLTYNLTRHLAVDGEVLRFPQSHGNYGYTQAMAGLKAGFRYEGVGVFAKLRPGAIHFNGDGFRLSNNGSKTRMFADVGGVLEFYLSSGRVAVRIDFGDTIIPFGSEEIIRGGGMRSRPGTTHSLQSSFGISLRL